MGIATEEDEYLKLNHDIGGEEGQREILFFLLMLQFGSCCVLLCAPSL